jgi:hypothetical protein
VIKAVWTAGWTAAAAPEPLKHAVINMVAIMWGTRATLAVDSTGPSGGQSVTPVKPSIPHHVQELLAPYRLIGAYGMIP